MAKRTSVGIVAGAPDEGGVLVISDSVLEEIAHTEAMGTEGVVPPLEGGGLLHRRPSRGIRMTISGNEVTFHLTIGVRDGVRMPEVAAAVRRRVAEAVRSKTGYAVRSVDVLIDHVAVEDEGAKDS